MSVDFVKFVFVVSIRSNTAARRHRSIISILRLSASNRC